MPRTLSKFQKCPFRFFRGERRATRETFLDISFPRHIRALFSGDSVDLMKEAGTWSMKTRLTRTTILFDEWTVKTFNGSFNYLNTFQDRELWPRPPHFPHTTVRLGIFSATDGIRFSLGLPLLFVSVGGLVPSS